MKKILLIINPCSGTKRMQSELLNVIKKFNEHLYKVEVAITLSKGYVKKIIENIDNDIDLIVCSGGDGTLNEVVHYLLKYNVNIPVGYIPSGSTNDFANTLGLTSNIKDNVNVILNGSEHLIDVGLFNNSKHFIYVASFGIFTSVSYNTPQEAKNAFGHLAYVFNGLLDLANIKTYNVKVTTKETIFEGDYILGAVLNTTSLGGVVKINMIDVDLSDGLFEVVLVKRPKDFNDYNKIMEGVINNKFTSDVFDFIKTDEIIFEFKDEKNIDWALDGEKQKSLNKVTIKNLNNKISIIK